MLRVLKLWNLAGLLSILDHKVGRVQLCLASGGWMAYCHEHFATDECLVQCSLQVALLRVTA